MALRTLDAQLQGDEPLDLHVVCPAADLPVVASNFSALRLARVRLTLHDEAAFLGAGLAADPTLRGSARQQIIKLAFAAACPAPFVLTLDSDILLIRPLDPALLVPDGRGLLQAEPVRIHPAWWEASGRVLGRPVAYEQGMSVTPAVLAAAGARSLAAALTERAGGADWRDFLAAWRRQGVIWTEYTLYFHHLACAGLLDALHVRAPEQRLFTQRSVWVQRHFEGWDLEQARSGEGWFAVVQSSAGIPIEAIELRIASLFEPAGAARLAPGGKRV